MTPNAIKLSAKECLSKLTPSEENLCEIKKLAIKITKFALATLTLIAMVAIAVSCFLHPATIILGTMLVPVIYYQGKSALYKNMVGLYTNQNLKDIGNFYANIPSNTLKGFYYYFSKIGNIFQTVGEAFHWAAKQIKVDYSDSPLKEDFYRF